MYSEWGSKEGDGRGRKEMEGKWGGGLIHSDKEVVEEEGGRGGGIRKGGTENSGDDCEEGNKAICM